MSNWSKNDKEYYIDILNKWDDKIDGDKMAIIDEAIDLFPQSAFFFIKKGKYYESKMDWVNAKQSFVKALSCSDVYPGVLIAAAHSCQMLEDFDLAEKYVTRFLEIYPNDSSAKQRLNQIQSLKSRKAIIVENIGSKVNYITSIQVFGINKSPYKFGDMIDVCIEIELNKRFFDPKSFILIGETKCVLSENDGKIVLNKSICVGKKFSITYNQEGLKYIELYSLKYKYILQVLHGLNGWLFLDNDTNHSVDIHRGRLSHDSTHIQKWNSFALSIKGRFKHTNFSFLIAPSKETIYEMYYPHGRSKNRMVYTVSNIFSKHNLCFVNPIQELRNYSETYYPTDTHWSDYGALIAFQKWLNKVLGINIDIDNYCFDYEDVLGDLGSKIDPPTTSRAKSYMSEIQHVKMKVFDNFLPNSGYINVFENPKSVLDKKIVIFGDSFLKTGCFYKYVIEYFSRVVLINSPGCWIDEIIEIESPDFVLCEMTERYLLVPPTPSRLISDSLVKSSFDRLNGVERLDKIKRMKENFSDNFYTEIHMGWSTV